MPLPPLPLVVLDTETTGFVPRVHRVIEFASVTVRDGKISDRYEQLFHAKEVPPIVEVLTRIRTKDLQGQPLLEQKREDVLAHIPEDAVIVGQNVNFDLGMLKGEGIDLTERPWIDTSMLASLAFPEFESYSLGYMSAVLKLDHAHKHRAMGDVEATLAVLERVWERLLELPAGLIKDAQKVLERSTRGYQLLFANLPVTKNTKKPTWLTLPSSGQTLPQKMLKINLPKPVPGKIALVEEPLDAYVLCSIIRAAKEDKSRTHWIAVKNLEATVHRLPEEVRNDADVRILYPPFLVGDERQMQNFLKQETFTADEGTLALKLHWYEPTVRADMPIHGGEDAIWSGKLASTEESDRYRAQFHDLPRVLLVDHRQLLSFVGDSNHSTHNLSGDRTHVIIDDASMLEDAATKAYGHVCNIDELRAAASVNPQISKLVDLVQLWVERVRQFQDLRMLAKSDLGGPDARGLRQQIETALEQDLPPRLTKILEHLHTILDLEELRGHLAWIETQQNGRQILHSVPEHVGPLLDAHLYSSFATTLFIPAGSATNLHEIVPHGTERNLAQSPKSSSPMVALNHPAPLEEFFAKPPEGKTILLLSSKSAIEDVYVKYAEDAERRGITLICQGVSGGQGRMQAEFIAATAPAILVVTPWTFEGIDLPQCADSLIVRTLPFDHPSHPVIGARAGHYRDGFHEYCLPRLMHRLFRLLRTFSRIQTARGTVSIEDERLWTKEYGKIIREYLGKFGSREEAKESAEVPAKKSKKDEGQMSLF